MWSNTQWTEEKISSRGKIMKLIKSGRTMNSLPPWRYPNNLRTLLEKWTSCSENRKEQQDINQIKISWDCALENHMACTEFCSYSSLQSWLTPGILRDTKTPMCPEPLQVLLARAQGGYLIKKWILTGEKEISHTLYFTRNSNGISTWIWDETQHQERYYGTFAVLRLQKLLSVWGSKARRMVCKAMSSKDKNIPSGTKKLLDTMEWPEGMENFKGKRELKGLTPLLWGISAKRAWAVGWNQMFSPAHPPVGVS